LPLRADQLVTLEGRESITPESVRSLVKNQVATVAF
jgi:hypothetical protein